MQVCTHYKNYANTYLNQIAKNKRQRENLKSSQKNDTLCRETRMTANYSTKPIQNETGRQGNGNP